MKVAEGTVKVADFGMCAKMGSVFMYDLNQKCGTRKYMPPELIKGQKYSYVCA